MKRARSINHAAVSAAARQTPNQWHLAGEYGSSQSAKSTAICVRAGVGNSLKRAAEYYGPAGSFEARTELTEWGCALHIRYVGAGADTAQADALGAVAGGAR